MAQVIEVIKKTASLHSLLCFQWTMSIQFAILSLVTYFNIHLIIRKLLKLIFPLSPILRTFLNDYRPNYSQYHYIY